MMLGSKVDLDNHKFNHFFPSFSILQLIMLIWCNKLCPGVWWTCWLDGRDWQTEGQQLLKAFFLFPFFGCCCGVCCGPWATKCEQNNQAFEELESTTTELKMIALRSLFDWMAMTPTYQSSNFLVLEVDLMKEFVWLLDLMIL